MHDNENGILSGANTASNIVIENSEFGHNGFGTGYTHNLYIGNVASLTFRYNFSHDAHVGHNLKSRARVNMIAYNRFSSLRAGENGSTAAGQPSYEIDLPNAGTSYVIGNVIQQPSVNQNPGMLAYGEEGASNPGRDLYVINNTFLNEDSSRGTFVLVGSTVTILRSCCKTTFSLAPARCRPRSARSTRPTTAQLRRASSTAQPTTCVRPPMRW